MFKILIVRHIVLLVALPLFCIGQNRDSKRYIKHRNEFARLSQLPPSLGRDTLIINELDSLMILGNIADPKYTKGFDVFEHLKKYADKTNWSKGKAVLNFWEGIRRAGGEDILALKYLIAAEKEFKRLNDIKHQSYALIKLGLIASLNNKDISTPLAYINQGIELAKKSKTSSLIFMGLNAKGSFYESKNDYKKCLEVYKEYDALNDPFETNNLANKLNIGICYLNLDSTDLALDYILPTLKKIPPETGHQRYLHWALYEALTQHFITHKDYKNAQKYLLKTKEYDNLGDNGRFGLYDYQIQKGFGNFKESLKHLEIFREFELNKRKVEDKNSLEGIKSQLALKEQNEKLQKSELEKLQFQNERQNQFRWLFIALSIIGLLTIIYIFRTNKKLKKNNLELLAKNAEISAALLQGQTIERKRVAADLHDSLGSTMSSLIYTVNAIDTNHLDDQEQKVYRHLKQMLDTAYNEIRLLSHNLLPEEFEKQGLAEALKHFVRKINQTKAIEFDLTIDPKLGRLSPKIEFELYSICLELINNILKHSKATQAKINLSAPNRAAYRLNGELKLVISDNGRGFFDNDSDGKGIKNVKARVESLGGEWHIQNLPEGGMESEIVVPV